MTGPTHDRARTDTRDDDHAGNATTTGAHTATATKPDHDAHEAVREITERVVREVPGLETLWLWRSTMGHVVLSMIRARERGQGAGEAAMRLLTAWADEHGVTLALTPDPHPLPGERRMNTRRLRSWYVRHGFATNRGRRNRDFTITETMVRRPRAPQA